MRIALAGILVVGALSGTAAAEGKWSAGVGLGMIHSEENAQNDANSTLGLFGRYQLSRRLAAQLEVARIQTEDGSGSDLRTASLLGVIDLTRAGRGFVPIAVLGLGMDNETTEYLDRDYLHGFLGVGVEYRAENGLRIGFDLRLGGRVTTEPQYETLPVEGDVLARYPAPDLEEGEYRAARITLGVAF